MHDYPPGAFGAHWFYKPIVQHAAESQFDTPLHPGVRKFRKRAMYDYAYDLSVGLLHR